MNQTPILPLWNRQAQLQRQAMEDKDTVYQISTVPKAHPEQRPTVIAMTSKASAQKIISQMASHGDSQFMYKVSMFKNPSLPGLEPTR
jgi:hypothetical protein